MVGGGVSLVNIYTLDLETDPFLRGRKPEPFCAGLYDGNEFWSAWGGTCVDDIFARIWELDPGIIYVHNGGKFDIFYMLHHIDPEKDMLIIKDRIVQAHIKCANGHHKLRDSLKILPFSLSTYQKTEIDYQKLESVVREEHKEEIISYLKDDCVFLHQLCVEYIATFGPSITIGATAIKELRKHHDTGAPLIADIDGPLRKNYFIGGRVERYQKGVFEGSFKVYDVNSMYPYVMSAFYHPIDQPSLRSRDIGADTYFITAHGYSRGAFPKRGKTGISFPVGVDTFSVTIHEWRAAEELGLFDVYDIIECVDFDSSKCFYDYIAHFYNLRKKAIEEGDKIKSIFYKFLLNNSYGKFAVNPENFKEYRITDAHTDMRWHGFQIAELIEGFDLILWSKPSDEFKYVNVATGASITGAARSVLLRGLYNAVNPMYCDTDCIICEQLPGVDIDDSALGSWKLEKSGNRLAIAGRKMYALFDGDLCIKHASKGVRIDPSDIERAARGEVILYERDSPTYRLNVFSSVARKCI